VAATIEVYAPLSGRDPGTIETVTIAPRPGEKPYEELMTEDESSRARDIGSMYAVLPAIDGRPDVIRAYAGADPAPVRPYRSDGAEPISFAEVRSLIADTVSEEVAAR
jgi:FlaA1/EpsC-like NDP-sugar epimerase